MTQRKTALSLSQRDRHEQYLTLDEAETNLGLKGSPGSSQNMAEAMGLPYHSYKDLKSGRRLLRPIHRIVIELLVENQRLKAGRRKSLAAA
jgi:hypothetical protein